MTGLSDRNLVTDASRFFAATLSSRLLQFAYFLVVMRSLGADDRGRYSLTLALASIAAAVMALGYEAAVARAIGRAPQERWRILRAALFSKALLGGGVLAVMAGAGFLAWRADTKATLLALFGLSVFLESLLACYLALFQATGELFRNGRLMLLGSFLTLVGAGGVAAAGGGVVGFALLVVAAQGARLAAAMRMARPHRTPREGGIDRGVARRLWEASATIGLQNLLGLLFVWADTLVLGFLKGDAALGEYAPVRTLTGHAGLIPMTLRTAVFPAFVALAAGGGIELGRLYGRCCQVLLAFALPIALLGSFLAAPLTEVLFGGGGPAASALVWYMEVLPWAVPFSFLQSLCALALVAMGRERRLLAPQVLVTVGYVGLLAWGARAAGGKGVAAGVLAGTVLNFLVFLPLLRDLRISWGRWIAGPAGAAAAAAAVFWLPVPWWAQGGVFLGVYAAALVLLGVFRRDHLALLLKGKPA